MVRQILAYRRAERWAPLDENVDHVRGSPAGRLILEYGDYECPYSRQAYRSIERVESELAGGLRFAFRHFPLTDIHPHALAASRASEAAALQGRFWEMHELLFHCQKALENEDLRRYASELGLHVAQFDSDRSSDAVLDRIERLNPRLNAFITVTADRPAGTPRCCASGSQGQSASSSAIQKLILPGCPRVDRSI